MATSSSFPLFSSSVICSCCLVSIRSLVSSSTLSSACKEKIAAVSSGYYAFIVNETFILMLHITAGPCTIPEVNNNTIRRNHCAILMKCKMNAKYIILLRLHFIHFLWGFATLLKRAVINCTLSRVFLRATLLVINLWARLSFSCSRRRLACWSWRFSFCKPQKQSIKVSAFKKKRHFR